MKYNNMIKAKFIERPNRFVAYCDINGEVEKIHVKNTGKCKELLVPGHEVYLEESNNPARATKYSLIAVKKGDRLINMDSQVTNKMVYEALEDKSLILPEFDEEITLIKPEKTYGNSRFDVYVEGKTKKAFIEVKGCTLEIDGVVKFPDAKTERGVKHVKELIKAKEEGYLAYIILVIQMKDVLYFTPNVDMHKEFGDVLKEADEKGVKVLAYDSKVEIDNITLNNPVKVIL
ncbi:Sugar fermentation stimulation protein A [bioreactor metagenome]|uniref:Sugar fermentation stimulation protein A n=1 Tax=bioreactor metagenome TaxID=1076179 RepID=A0A645B276_9ZZZZ